MAENPRSGCRGLWAQALALALLIGTSPLFAVEGLVAIGLKEAGALPELPAEPRLLRVHRALWAVGERRRAEEVEPLSAWAILQRFAGKKPPPGEGLAVHAARVFVARDGRVRPMLKWHAANFGLTVWLTRHASAEQLVGLYATGASFGRGAVGIEQAAWAWFGTRPEDVTWGQAALLAALTDDPRRLDPRCAPERALRSRHRVLERLESFGIIDSIALADADAEPLLPRTEECPSEVGTD